MLALTKRSEAHRAIGMRDPCRLSLLLGTIRRKQDGSWGSPGPHSGQKLCKVAHRVCTASRMKLSARTSEQSAAICGVAMQGMQLS